MSSRPTLIQSHPDSRAHPVAVAWCAPSLRDAKFRKVCEDTSFSRSLFLWQQIPQKPHVPFFDRTYRILWNLDAGKRLHEKLQEPEAKVQFCMKTSCKLQARNTLPLVLHCMTSNVWHQRCERRVHQLPASDSFAKCSFEHPNGRW